MSDTIFVDRREPSSRINRLAAAGFDPQVPESELDSGDIILLPPHQSGKRVGIEVKTTQELLTLVPSGLSNLQQFQRMLDFEFRVLLVVGSYGTWGPDRLLRDNYDRRESSYSSVQGALFNLQAHLGFIVRFCGTEHELGNAIRNIFDFYNKNHILLAKPRPLTLSHPSAEALAFLMCIPGIGQDKAQKILTKYGTLAWAISSVESWDDEIEGIGPLIRKKAHEFMRRAW